MGISNTYLRSALILCLLAVLAIAPLAQADESEIIESIVQSRLQVKSFELPSTRMDGLDIKRAYELQKKLSDQMAKKGISVIGFKAGLTSEPTQKKFKVDSPVFGPFFKGANIQGDPLAVNVKEFVRPFLETEVAFIVGERIDSPINDVKDLKPKIKSVAAAIEVPDIRFSAMKGLIATDIITDAVGSARFILGKEFPADKVDLSKVSVKLRKDGSVINSGKAVDALGGQWIALKWLVNEALNNGWTIEPGHVLLTGALGKMLPAKPGEYKAEYSELGSIAFKVIAETE